MPGLDFMEETHCFDWMLIRETDKARLFEDSGGERRCMVELPEWFCEKEGLL